MREQIPDIIKDNDRALSQWIVGLIDGDGSICYSNRNLKLQILSSYEVVKYIAEKCPIKTSIRQHKDLELYELDWCNQRALRMVGWLNPRYGLNRKWSKVQDFILHGRQSREKHLNNIRKSPGE